MLKLKDKYINLTKSYKENYLQREIEMENQKLKSYFLDAGKVIMTKEKCKIVTVLGSCISVTMFHPKLKIAAICHALYPECENKHREQITNSNEVFKYVDCSIIKMCELFEKENISLKDVEVKVFGGAELLNNNPDNKFLTVGKKNIESATSTLERKNLHIKNSNVGGKEGRKIIFYTETGEVYMKKIKNE